MVLQLIIADFVALLDSKKPTILTLTLTPWSSYYQK